MTKKEENEDEEEAREESLVKDSSTRKINTYSKYQSS
jgi:hypothetical protein